MITGESMDLKFAIGDKVVHPQHGVGFVSGLEEKQFEPNVSRIYYVVSISETTLWVPVDLSTSGLRKLSLKRDIEQCRQVLQDTPQELNPGRDFLSNLFARIKQGTIIDRCEVIRDLAAYGQHKPLIGSIADFQRTVLNILCEEWAIVKGITNAEASLEINNLLKIGKAAKGS